MPPVSEPRCASQLCVEIQPQCQQTSKPGMVITARGAHAPPVFRDFSNTYY